MSEAPFVATLANVHWGTVAEIVSAVATLGIVAVAFVQLRRFNRQVRADFTYKVYRDLREWLRTHPNARQWLNNPDREPLGDHYDEWDFDEFLTYFEAVWSLWLKRLVDREMVYDLLSDDLITTYEANDREIEKIIRGLRTEEPDADDVFIGVEQLYDKMKRRTRRQTPAWRGRA